MPANLTPEYRGAEARFRAAENDEQKLEALEQMYSTIPKHKGTEKMRADIKRRMSKIREKSKHSSTTRKHFDDYFIAREGSGQIVLLGPPNSGKSSIFSMLTSAETEVASYSYTTQNPIPGMLEYNDILIQLIDTPPISAEHIQHKVIDLARSADSIGIILDGSDEILLDSFEEIRARLSNSNIGFIAVNKMDVPDAHENFDILKEHYGDEFVIHPISAHTEDGLEALKYIMFSSLGIIRIYSKEPGRPADMGKPFTLKKGSTLLDFAAKIHKDFIRELKFGRAWGAGIIEGAQIARDHILEDGYVVELHK